MVESFAVPTPFRVGRDRSGPLLTQLDRAVLKARGLAAFCEGEERREKQIKPRRVSGRTRHALKHGAFKHQRHRNGGPNGIRTRVWALPRFRRRYHAVGACLVHDRGDRPQTCRSIRPLKLAASCLTRLESVRSRATRSDRPQTCRPRMARRQFSATWGPAPNRWPWDTRSGTSSSMK